VKLKTRNFSLPDSCADIAHSLSAYSDIQYRVEAHYERDQESNPKMCGPFWDTMVVIMASTDDFAGGRALTSSDSTSLGARLGAVEGAIGPSPLGFPVVPSYTVLTLPSATGAAGGLVFVTNETGGAVLAFSDATNWRRVTDRAIVS
jgi:hypothetical protein